MKFHCHLVKAVREASIFNSDVQVAPACILWPDSDKQWESIIPRLQEEIPELLVLGNYAPEKRTGPAIWLRCAIAGKINDIALPEGSTPIIYLPGVSRQDLRAVESCLDDLKAIVELQYRGVIWSQINAKDWTVLAYLKSDQGGLGLDVAQDNDTKNAILSALTILLDEEVKQLKGKRLDKDYFYTLLTGGDPVRDLLQWLDMGDEYKSNKSDNEWKAFVEVCKSQWAFNPESEGILAGAAKLANHDGIWSAVWGRYCESPKRYPNIPVQIRKCKMPDFGLFSDSVSTDGWPQGNENQEKNLLDSLMSLNKLTAPEACKKIIELEKQHSYRRKFIWAELGESPLACALQHLAVLAEITADGLDAGTVDDMTIEYLNNGWKADDAVVQALSIVNNPTDYEAVALAIRSMYLPWVEDSARHLQSEWNDDVNGKRRFSKNEVNGIDKTDCMLFIDGLRIDTAKRLEEMLKNEGINVSESPVWAALPSLTGTGKPAVAPIAGSNSISETPEYNNFEPLNAYQFKKVMEDNGWKVIRENDPIPAPILSPNEYAVNKIWCEFGNIDHEGHDRGWKLAKQIDILLTEIRDRIKSLLAAGWNNIRVVTDHGWLLIPGGLPKIDLPVSLTENKWGRCATIKPGASVEEKFYPWYWNPNQHFALADGISCFKNGEEYTHGGLSLQECLTIQLIVSRDATALSPALIEITDVAWKGMRCTVAVVGNYSGLSLDIRTQAGNLLSSVVVSVKSFNDDGIASVIIENENLEGQSVSLVVLNSNVELAAQVATVIGGGK